METPITQAPPTDYYQLELDKYLHFLLYPRFDLMKIEVVVHKDLEPVEIVQGFRCQDIYNYIIEKYEDLSKLHCAYLGKELKKVEIALALGIKDFFQE